jgi:glycosyltransferase involved in cell wall biosynthesis
VYVTPEDVAALRATILRLLDDPETTARIGAEARRYVEAEADVVVYARRLAALTLDAIRRQTTPG